MVAKLSILWTGGTAGQGKVTADHLDMAIAVPGDRGGSGKGTDPKTLMIASAASCYTMNLTGILQHRKLPVETVSIISEGSDPKSDFTIQHHIEVKLASDATEEQVNLAQSAFEAADKACTIGNLLKKAGAEISVAGSVKVGA